MRWLLKYLASFLKHDWNLDDYPIRFRHQADESLGRLEPIPWIAQIDRWPRMTGTGATKDAALEDLREQFERVRSEGLLPRPGTEVPLEFASTRYVDAYADIARDVLQNVFELDYDSCFISDESSLWDFDCGDSLEQTHARIRELYDVDVSDIANGNLVDIFERIRVARKASRS